jgi:hypothetical protein
LLIASRQSLLAHAPSGRAKTDLGLAYLLRAGSTNERDAQRLILEHAVLHLRSGLAEAPARPHAWTRLALAEIALNGPSANAAAAFKLAVETGRYDRALVLARVRLGLALESYLPPTGKRLLEDQIRIAWDVRGSELMTLAEETGTGAVIEAALQGRQ